MEVTYKTSETVDIVQVDFHHAILYKTGGNMNMQSYEQMKWMGNLSADTKYLKEGIDVVVGLYESPCRRATAHKNKIQGSRAPPAVRGDSAPATSLKKLLWITDSKYRRNLYQEGEEFW